MWFWSQYGSAVSIGHGTGSDVSGIATVNLGVLRNSAENFEILTYTQSLSPD